ncbi:ATP-dependent DNA helicase RecG [Aerococcaceae bacterium NML210727]|nr:ATP-dependent DNA helicase RecG [Aerococcaceae bacterium NML210727]MCW6654641.1 ATP-dependent DNA helicase RecG [Aerococcaceae bacterium NML201296]MCW6674634.1 ATP-dependent DNA helicase RecG [Aerococcaceae bacterium NML171108]
MDWLDAVTQVKGVGPARAKLLQQLDIYTVKDLLFHFPFRFEDIQARDLATILDQEKVTLKGRVVTPPVVQYYGGRKNRLSFKLAVGDHDIIQVTFFNQPYLKQSIQLGQDKAIYGKWQSDKQTLLGMKVINAQQEDDEFAPVYRATKGLKQQAIVQSIQAAFQAYGDLIPEVLPQALNDKYRLISLRQALYQMHFPNDEAERTQAKRKIIFQEFFLYQWRLQLAAQRQRQSEGVRVYYDVTELKGLIQRLPYELTGAQKKAVNEICYDLMASYPMRRMLQGDVGSGKTLVAFLAMIATVQAGFQTALMVPTEILAKQHLESFNKLFEPMGLHAELLVSAMTTTEKRQTIEGLQTGRIRLVIGTHALIQENINFKQLGLVVIDEQHRFGVKQRQTLLEKGASNETANLLQMTATPIPRSLAMTLYGELSVSTIDERPKGRQPIQTELVEEEQIEHVYQAMARELQAGHQVYYVLPLIESSEHLEQIENVLEIAAKLTERFPNYRVGMLHGQLDKAAQQAVMQEFTSNQVQILVATTMVEVGVDVPNATIIVIQSAERFGLAQLHQLRGRVGRSHLASYCYLIANPTTEQGKSRMQIMVEQEDGFLISQEDLKIRGMGDILGRTQSGLPQFHYANLFEDRHILQVAQQEVAHYLKQPEQLSQTEYDKLTRWMTQQEIEI